MFLLMIMQRRKNARKKFRRLFMNNINIHSHRLRLQMLLSGMRTSLFGLNFRKPRSVWAYERQEFWFNRMLYDLQEDENFNLHWRQDFRMTLPTFMKIVELVRPRMEKRDTRFRRAIPIEKRVAIAIWRLSTGNSFRTVSKTFAVGKSTAVSITRKFCREMRRLAHLFIKFPSNRRETAQAIEQFKMCYDTQIPQAVGAIDGTHINIVAPEGEGKEDYFSRKQRYTINTQGVVGANLIFHDIATGFPGSCHDARNLRNSSIFRRAQNDEILIKPVDIVHDFEVRPFIIGDSAYPLLTWLITPFPFGPALTRDQKKFNKKLSGGRVHVERAFGILKARWRCLLKRLDNEIENVSTVIIACCTLHNICQMNNEDYIDRDGVLERILRQERESRQRRRQDDFEENPDGISIRNAIVDLINE